MAQNTYGLILLDRLTVVFSQTPVAKAMIGHATEKAVCARVSSCGPICSPVMKLRESQDSATRIYSLFCFEFSGPPAHFPGPFAIHRPRHSVFRIIFFRPSGRFSGLCIAKELGKCRGGPEHLKRNKEFFPQLGVVK